jgi:hypothetical protein
MKVITRIPLLLSLACALFVSGCASAPPVQISGTAGPAPAGEPVAQGRGWLMVYSAWDPFSSGDPERNYHGDYVVCSPDNPHGRRVANHLGFLDEGPVAHPLPPGTYTIKARAARYGMVAVNAVVQRGKTTVIRLDGRGAAAPTVASSSHLQLPNGEVIGWKAVQ